MAPYQNALINQLIAAALRDIFPSHSFGFRHLCKILESCLCEFRDKAGIVPSPLCKLGPCCSCVKPGTLLVVDASVYHWVIVLDFRFGVYFFTWELELLRSALTNMWVLAHRRPVETINKGRGVFKCSVWLSEMWRKWRIVAAVLFHCPWDCGVGSGGGVAASWRKTCCHHGLCAGMETTGTRPSSSNAASH